MIINATKPTIAFSFQSLLSLNIFILFVFNLQKEHLRFDHSFVLPFSVDKVENVVRVFRCNIESGLRSSLLVLNPVPEPDQIPKEIINKIISKSISKMKSNKISGKETTPFLLKDIAKQTKNKSLKTNISLALNNVRLGAKIARRF